MTEQATEGEPAADESGLLLAASTGITLRVPPLAELKATLEASEREAQACMAAAAKTGATPDASEVA